MNTKLLFQYVSYLQYPLMAVAIFFMFRPYLGGHLPGLANINSMLIFMGLAISFSTLQDTQKTQNKLSKNIWENPRKGKVAITIFSILTISFIGLGLYSYFATTNNELEEVSFGLIVFGIGMLGLLKAAIELFENHRIDKKEVDLYDD